jgi:hypothetical protein
LIIDIPLTAGILIRGRVTDSRTGTLVPGSVEYFAFRTNPHLQETPNFEGTGSWIGPIFYNRSAASGFFEIPAFPGKGILAFRADGRQFPLGTGPTGLTGPSSNAAVTLSSRRLRILASPNAIIS